MATSRLPTDIHEQSSVFSSQSTDILLQIIQYLPPSSFVSLAATCRLLWHHALTTFQPYGHALACRYKWLLALNPECSRMEPEARIKTPNFQSSSDGDWLQYVGKCYRSKSMRFRRHIWGICRQIKDVYQQKIESFEDAEGLAELEKRAGVAFGLRNGV